MLEKILSVSGKPGLYKMLTNNQKSMVVESLIDGKRTVVFANQRMVSLNDISMYTNEGDKPLREILQLVADKENKGKCPNPKEMTSAEIIDYMESILPDYDADRVHVSDMTKLLTWYNLLQSKDLMDFTEENKEEETEAKEEAAE